MSHNVTIIGGGITGLCAALLLSKAGKKVQILEASDQFGGLLATFPIAGNRLEFFYHHFFTHDAEILWLLDELGLKDQIEFHPSSMGVFHKGIQYPFNGPKDLLGFSPLNFFNKLQFGFSSLYLSHCAKWQTAQNISTLDWFRKWAGKQTTEKLWEPMMKIKFGPHANEIPLSWMIGRLSQRVKSRDGSEEKLGYLKGSLHVLLDKLLAKLKSNSVTLLTNQKVEKINFLNNKIQSIQTNSNTHQSDQYLFTIPTLYLHPFFQDSHPDYAKQLSKIEYFGAVCTVLELKKSLGKYYWLNITDPDYSFGGVIEHTQFISPDQYQGNHLLYLSRYFSMKEAFSNFSDDMILDKGIEDLKRIYPNLQDTDILSKRIFKTRTAATLCDLNFFKKVPNVQSPIENCFVANMAHVYPDERSANNAIRVAANACKVMGLDTSYVTKNKSLAGLIGTRND